LVPNILVDALDTPATGWIPPTRRVASPAPRSAAFAEILETLRQEVGLGQRIAPLPVREPPPVPEAPQSDTVPADFALRIEGQLGFLQKAARRWHRDRAHADDLVQDTVVQALANAHLWRGNQPDSNLRGWLFTIMRNRFLAGRIRWKRSETALDTIATADECVPAVASRPEARLMMRDVERAMTLLSTRQRTAIRLVGVEGRSQDEAARLMGLSVAALRCHLWRGRERLREIVEGSAGSTLPRSAPLRCPAETRSRPRHKELA
jgi:RNA polymerase sigma-70 factor (ECF subfamily)